MLGTRAFPGKRWSKQSYLRQLSEGVSVAKPPLRRGTLSPATAGPGAEAGAAPELRVGAGMHLQSECRQRESEDCTRIKKSKVKSDQGSEMP